jgi:hypothetical protein
MVLRRIEAAVHIRRETIGGYLRAAGIPVRSPGGWGRRGPAKPANEVITDSGAESVTIPVPQPHSDRGHSASACEPYSELIQLGHSRAAAMRGRSGRTWSIAMASLQGIRAFSASSESFGNQ